MCNFLRGDNVYEEKLEDIVYENFNITACLVHGQVRQGEGAFFSTVGKPRRINGFFYFYDCDGEYTLKNGEKSMPKGEMSYFYRLFANMIRSFTVTAKSKSTVFW